MFTKILHRPAMAIVISIILLFLGGLGIKTLPVSQFPSIAPPTVEVAIAYPGASAEVLVDSVLIPLEQSINGVQGQRYMVSDATSAGEGTIRVFFEPGTDPDLAVVNVQNRVNIVLNRLPPLVQREGTLVSQVVPSMLMNVNIYSTDPGYNQSDLFNFANVTVMPRLKRIKGMGRPVNLGNRTFAMRIWLNPEELRKRQLSTEDVMKAVAEQSVIGSPGRLGQATGQVSQSKEYVLTYKGRYNRPDEYGDVILRATPEGEILRLRDVCGTPDPIRRERPAVPALVGGAGGQAVPEPKPGIELGSEFFDIYSDVDGLPAASIVLKQNPGSNAATVIEEVKKELEEIKKESFPPGMDYQFAYDVSKFLDASIEKVVHTLIEAFILVSLVVYMFLGDVRSTLIPILAVPVSLVGTFIFLLMFGLSLNLITLFALVLAIGVVVDNAIVVVEAVHVKMSVSHLSPYAATAEVLREISGAIIAITLVMTAVFVPVTFIPGPVGTFYRTFAITMATAITLSGVVALTLTPVLCAMILKPHGGGDRGGGGRQPHHRHHRRRRHAPGHRPRRAGHPRPVLPVRQDGGRAEAAPGRDRRAAVGTGGSASATPASRPARRAGAADGRPSPGPAARRRALIAGRTGCRRRPAQVAGLGRLRPPAFSRNRTSCSSPGRLPRAGRGRGGADQPVHPRRGGGGRTHRRRRRAAVPGAAARLPGGADVSWQVDIWRQLRNARDAAGLRVLATAEGRNFVTTRLVAEVAENYYALMALDTRLTPPARARTARPPATAPGWPRS